MQTVSHSEAETYSLCKRKHFYSYGLEIQTGNGSGNISDALYGGIIGHRGLAFYYQGKKDGVADPCDYAIENLHANYSVDSYKNTAVAGRIEELIEGYARVNGENDWTVLEIESSSYYELVPGELRTQIRPDLVVHQPGKGVGVVDFKFVYDFMPQITLETAPQIPKYIVGLREQGHNVTWGMLDQIRTRVLKAPEDKDLYRQSLIELSPGRIRQTMLEHAQISGEIYALKEMGIEDWEDRTTRVGNKMVCNSCAFKDLCINDIHGRDRTNMVKYYYAPKRGRVEIPTGGTE